MNSADRRRTRCWRCAGHSYVPDLGAAGRSNGGGGVARVAAAAAILVRSSHGAVRCGGAEKIDCDKAHLHNGGSRRKGCIKWLRRNSKVQPGSTGR